MSTIARTRLPPGFLILIVGGCLFLALARGLLETRIGKQQSYGVQLIVIFFLLASLLMLGSPHRRPGFRAIATLTYGFVLCVLLSAGLTTVFHPTIEPLVYSAVSLTYAMLFFAVSALEYQDLRGANLHWVLIPIAIVVFGVAFLQQRGGDPAGLNGSDTASLLGLVRPSSITGSYLHDPLAGALLFIIFVQLAASRKNVFLWLLAGAAGLLVVTSYSRSGALLIAAAMIAAAYLSGVLRGRGRILLALALVFVLAFALLHGTTYGARIFGAASLQAAGNTSRATRWEYGLSLWASSPIALGDITGAVTNSSGDFGAASLGVVESGVIQQLDNFGLLGCLFFYGMLFSCFRAVDHDHIWLRAGVIGALAESFVYQSIEVIPFMVTLALFPIVSTTLRPRSDTAPESDVSDPARASV